METNKSNNAMEQYKIERYIVLQIDESIYTSTEISSTGGGGYLHNGTGSINAPTISSSTQKHKEQLVWLKNIENDTEQKAPFSNYINARIGHVISVVTHISTMSLIAIYNVTTGTVEYQSKQSLLWKEGFEAQVNPFSKFKTFSTSFFSGFLTAIPYVGPTYLAWTAVTGNKKLAGNLYHEELIPHCSSDELEKYESERQDEDNYTSMLMLGIVAMNIIAGMAFSYPNFFIFITSTILYTYVSYTRWRKVIDFVSDFYLTKKESLQSLGLNIAKDGLATKT